jgi:hypothetical protein
MYIYIFTSLNIATSPHDLVFPKRTACSSSTKTPFATGSLTVCGRSPFLAYVQTPYVTNAIPDIWTVVKTVESKSGASNTTIIVLTTPTMVNCQNKLATHPSMHNIAIHKTHSKRRRPPNNQKLRQIDSGSRNSRRQKRKQRLRLNLREHRPLRVKRHQAHEDNDRQRRLIKQQLRRRNLQIPHALANPDLVRRGDDNRRKGNQRRQRVGDGLLCVGHGGADAADGDGDEADARRRLAEEKVVEQGRGGG